MEQRRETHAAKMTAISNPTKKPLTLNTAGRGIGSLFSQSGKSIPDSVRRMSPLHVGIDVWHINAIYNRTIKDKNIIKLHRGYIQPKKKSGSSLGVEYGRLTVEDDDADETDYLQVSYWSEGFLIFVSVLLSFHSQVAGLYRAPLAFHAEIIHVAKTYD